MTHINTYNSTITISPDKLQYADMVELKKHTRIKKHRLNREKLLFNPENPCFEICDKKICKITNKCIQNTIPDDQNINTKNFLPKLGLISTIVYDSDEHDKNTGTSKSRKKQLSSSIITSIFVHLVIFGVISAFIYLIHPNFTPVSGTNETALIDVMMVDTATMRVMPQNQIKVPATLVSQLSNTSETTDAIKLNEASTETLTYPKSATIPEINNQETNSALVKEPSNAKSINMNQPLAPSVTSINQESQPSISQDNSINPIAPKIFNNNGSVQSTTETPKKIKSENPVKQEVKKSQNKTHSATIHKNVKATTHNPNKKTDKIKPTIKPDSALKTTSSQKTKRDVEHSQTKVTAESNQKSTVQNADSNIVASRHEQAQDKNELETNTQNLYSSAKPIKRPTPSYPARAAALNLEDSVVIKFDVNNQGKVENIRVMSSKEGNTFISEIKTAMRKWQYEKIATKDLVVTFEFKLNGIILN